MTGKKVLSYSLFHHEDSVYNSEEVDVWRGKVYDRYLPGLIRAALTCFPGWEIRIHHDDSIWHNKYGSVLMQLEDFRMLRLIRMETPQKLCEGMLWRMAPAFDPAVETFVCRDVDGFATPRDRQIIEDWLTTDAVVHALLDSSAHTGPMMGGMIAFRGGAIQHYLGWSTLEHLLAAANNNTDLGIHGGDQIFLNRVVWPKLGRAGMVHQLEGRGEVKGAGRVRWEIRADMPDDIVCDIEEATALAPKVGHMYNHVEPVKFYDKVNTPAIQRIVWCEHMAGVPTAASSPVEYARRAVFSCDLNQDYAFYLPLTSILWRSLIGYHPVALLVGDAAGWSEGPCGVAARECRSVGCEVRFVQPAEGHRTSTVAQMCRMFAAALPYEEDRYLLTSDVDMWPLRREFFTAVPWESSAHLYYTPAPQYPICYIGASVKSWREIVGIEELNISKQVQRCLDEGLGVDDDSWQAWIFDEVWLGPRIQAWSGFPQATLASRHGGPPVDRIDRSCWRAWKPEDSDAHMLRPGYTEENWSRVRELFIQLMPDLEDWVDDYRSAFMDEL